MLINVKNTTFPSLLDLIAPPSCSGCGRLGSSLCDRCKNYILRSSCRICPNCKQPKSSATCPHCPDLPPIYVVGERRDLLAHLIHDYKYQSDRAIGRELAKLLDASLPPLPLSTVIIPLPTSLPHIRVRALDHTLSIAKSLAHTRHLTVEQALVRAHNTTQVGTDRRTRVSQASTAYALNTHTSIQPGRPYLLFDDVWTTGASMRAAIEIIRTAGATEILVALLAVSRFEH